MFNFNSAIGCNLQFLQSTYFYHFYLLIFCHPNLVLMVGVQRASLSTAGRNDATLTANRKTTIAMGFSMACGNSLHQGRYPDAEGKDTKPSNGCRQLLLSTVAVNTFPHLSYCVSWKETSKQLSRKTENDSAVETPASLSFGTCP